jgi:hypothetical protein
MKKAVLFITATLFSVLASANTQCAISKVNKGRVVKSSKTITLAPNEIGTIESRITDLEASEHVGGMIIGYTQDDLQISLYHTTLDVGATAANVIPVGVELSVKEDRYLLNCW